MEQKTLSFSRACVLADHSYGARTLEDWELGRE